MELLEALRKNREAHTAEYKEAYEGFKIAFIQECVKLLERAKEGKFDKQAIGLAAPMDHTKDYDRVIRMMEMCTAEEIIVSENQFSQYVLDEWNWQGQFKMSTAAYNGRNR